MSAVPSEAKLAANRANAQLSTGPTSEAGKAKVSLNAVKTGLTGRTVLLLADDVAAYQATVARFIEHWQPATAEECVLVQALADNDWRIQRIPSLEYGIYAEGACQFAEEFANEPDPQIRATRIQTKTFLTYYRQLMNLQLQDSRLHRQREKDEARLQKLQGDRKYQAAKELQQQRQREQQAEAAAANSVGSVFSNAQDQRKQDSRDWAREAVRKRIALDRAQDEAAARKKSA